MIGKRNKMVGRDLSFDNLFEIAQKYKTRGEFQKMDGSAYTIARVNGHLDNICKHMIKNQYSIPQLILNEIIKIIINEKYLYDTRKIIKPYELDIFIPKYNLAFEYDGKGWHQDNKNDEIKNYLCNSKNIKLIRIIENNRNNVKDVKEQLINRIDEINEYCKLNIKKEDIFNIDEQFLYDKINKNLLNDDDIKNIISKYNNYHDFRINEPKICEKLKKIKRLNEFTEHLKRNTINWNDENIKNEILKYEYLDDFYTKSNGCYQYIKRHKLNDDLNKIFMNLKYRKKNV